MERDKERGASESRRVRKDSIIGKGQPSAAIDYESAEAPLPSELPAMKSSMSSRVGYPSKQPSRAKDYVDCPSCPTSSSGSSGLQNSQPHHSEEAQSGSKETTSLTRGEQHGLEDELDQRVRIPPCTSEEARAALSTAMPHPPVTKEALEELDLEWISSNIRLRIDLNYDHSLEFTHDEGVKGQLKRHEARKYWLSLEAELRILYQHDHYPSCPLCEELSPPHSTESDYFKPRLPDMFLKLKELLTNLVPDREHDQIARYLDIPLLLQELSHGLMDIVRLAAWICQLLTSHCAPYRDQTARNMADQIREGAERGDLGALVAGVESLFGLLEAMQLDVANHQVRNLRGCFIADTVVFQRTYFQARMSSGYLPVDDSRDWYNDCVEQHKNKCRLPGATEDCLPFVALIHGLVGLCFTEDAEIPETLSYDTSRLRTLCTQIQDMVYLDICLCVFDYLVKTVLGRGCNPSLKHSILRQRLIVLTDSDTVPESTIAEIWQRHEEAVALELTYQALQFCEEPDHSLLEEEAARTAQILKTAFLYERQTMVRARTVARALEGATYKYAKSYQRFTARGISGVERRLQGLRPPSPGSRALATLNSLAGRLAHIAVIHWRVWSDLVYLRPAESHSSYTDLSVTDSNISSTDDDNESSLHSDGH